MALDPITGILNIVDDVISGVGSEKKAELAMKLQALQLQAQSDTAQAGTNTAEASSDNLFEGGWRPFIGWVCGVSFAWQFVALPIILLISRLTGHVFEPPILDVATMSTVLMGMLGLGGLRTFEKVQSTKK